VNVQLFVAGCSPAFRYKSSLRSGLSLQSGLETKLVPINISNSISGSHLKSAGEYLCMWLPADFAGTRRGFYEKVNTRFFVAACSPAFRYKSSLRSGLSLQSGLETKLVPINISNSISGSHLKSAGEYLCMWLPADFAGTRRGFYEKVNTRFFVAACSPAFRYKSSLRSGLLLQSGLETKLVPINISNSISGSHLKSAGEYLCMWLPADFADIRSIFLYHLISISTYL